MFNDNAFGFLTNNPQFGSDPPSKFDHHYTHLSKKSNVVQLYESLCSVEQLNRILTFLLGHQIWSRIFDRHCAVCFIDRASHRIPGANPP